MTYQRKRFALFANYKLKGGTQTAVIRSHVCLRKSLHFRRLQPRAETRPLTLGVIELDPEWVVG